MLETFVEFTFEAAHQIPPFSGIHGHTFRAVVHLTGERDPVFGWTHNLYEVEEVIAATKKLIDNSYLNEIEGLEVPSIENVAEWLWNRFEPKLPGLDPISLSRGFDGAQEGRVFSGRRMKSAA
ncbi:MAG: 6-carboxytetrahydropterin synthase [Rhodospirillales bacterium]|nr:6-carboxytetrahydropterin synthase [Rhodospirillales bacterium]